MSAVEEAIRNRAHLDTERRRMAEVVIATIGTLGPEPSPERTQWLSYGDSLLAAIDAEGSVEINRLLEEGYRYVLFMQDKRVQASRPPETEAEMATMVVFRSRQDIERRLA